MLPLQICIGPTIRISRESWCLPYAGFSLANFALLAGFFCTGGTIRMGREMLCLPYVGLLFGVVELCAVQLTSNPITSPVGR